ncbi:MAG: hypothetical protein HC837_04615 [Chloroflexaceae bacterium]|nr:hypothetical protein [Chloroflexaceae bacterium]
MARIDLGLDRPELLALAGLTQIDQPETALPMVLARIQEIAVRSPLGRMDSAKSRRQVDAV